MNDIGKAELFSILTDAATWWANIVRQKVEVETLNVQADMMAALFMDNLIITIMTGTSRQANIPQRVDHLNNWNG